MRPTRIEDIYVDFPASVVKTAFMDQMNTLLQQGNKNRFTEILILFINRYKLDNYRIVLLKHLEKCLKDYEEQRNSYEVIPTDPNEYFFDFGGPN